MAKEGMQVTGIGKDSGGNLLHMAFGDTDIQLIPVYCRKLSSYRIAVQTSFDLMHVGRFASSASPGQHQFAGLWPGVWYALVSLRQVVSIKFGEH